MNVLKIKKIFYLFSYLLVVNSVHAGLRIGIDISLPLDRSLSKVRRYIVNGYSSRHIFGINHLIMNTLSRENLQRMKKNKPPFDLNFSIIENKNLHLVFLYIDEAYDKKMANKIKKILAESAKEYSRHVPETILRFVVEPSAQFILRRPWELEIIQNVKVVKGYNNLNKLIAIIKKNFVKHNISCSTLDLGVHINYAKVISREPLVITLVKEDEKIANHLKSVRAPKIAAKAFSTKSRIDLYDGPKRLAVYDL
ncbi:hypothetical protein ACFLYU_05000 [Candidatus Dependentiae bacterium]